MIECDGKEVPNEILEKAWDIAQEHINKTIERQEAFLSKVDVTDLTSKVIYNKPSEALIAWTKNILTDDKLAELHRDGKSKDDF